MIWYRTFKHKFELSSHKAECVWFHNIHKFFCCQDIREKTPTNIVMWRLDYKEHKRPSVFKHCTDITVHNILTVSTFKRNYVVTANSHCKKYDQHVNGNIVFIIKTKLPQN